MKIVVMSLATIVAGAFLFAVIWGFWVWHRTNNLQQSFERVQKGDSETRVVELFGQTPYVTTNFVTNTSWDGVFTPGTNAAGTVRVLHFYPPFSICGESWEVGFDAHSNAL